MKLFIDSANIEEIKEVDGFGIISGVTTNPSIIAKEKIDIKSTIIQMCRIIDGPINIEVSGSKTEEIIREAREYASWHPNIAVKIPMTEKAIKATKILSSDGIRTNITSIYSANQALLAAIAGASFVSPCLGLIEDSNQEGISLINEIKTIFDNYVFDTQIITYDIRNAHHVTLAAKAGADIAAVPYSIFKQMFRHPFTDSNIKNSVEDWQVIKSLKVPQGV